MDHASAVQVVPAQEDDWTTLRAVRLAALADSPGAFGSTTAREVAFGEDRWRSWARSGRVFLAVADGTAVGLAAGALEDDRTDLVSMWVAPGWRGGSVASELLHAVVAWARQARAPEIGLAVATDNARAMAFYERHGFVRVTTRPSPRTRPSAGQLSGEDRAFDVHRMVLPLVR